MTKYFHIDTLNMLVESRGSTPLIPKSAFGHGRETVLFISHPRSLSL